MYNYIEIFRTFFRKVVLNMLELIDAINQNGAIIWLLLGLCVGICLPLSDKIRESKIIKVILVFLIGCAVLLAGFSFYMNLYTRVPKIVGYTVAEARIKLEHSGNLEFSSDFMKNDEQIIMTQEPKQNKLIKKGGTVYAEIYPQETPSHESMFKALLSTITNSNKKPLNGNCENIEYNDKSVYNGYYENGLPEGEGTYKTTTFEFIGYFVNALPQGQGIFNALNDNREYNFKKGDSYKGNWRAGFFNGKGTYIWANGNKYDGNWSNGRRDGEGIFTWKNGDICEGSWIKNEREGICKHTYDDTGDIFEGHYINDLRNGYGTHYYKDGGYNVGTWKDDCRHGTFLYYGSDDQFIYEENYVDGILQ